MTTLNTRVSVPDKVMFRELQGESVLLELESGRYFGLNDTGTRMWALLTLHGQIGPALADLQSEFDAPGERLEKELMGFVDTLAAQKLLELHES